MAKFGNQMVDFLIEKNLLEPNLPFAISQRLEK